MNKSFFLIIALTCLLNTNSKAQNQNVMNEKQMELRDGSVMINYLIEGQGETTLLFLHGWCINSSYWKNQLDYFQSDYRVCALDLPGFGNSIAQRDNWTIEEYANDVLAFMDKLNLKNVILIGHSMSGDIMLQSALMDSTRIKGLIGIDNFKVIDVEFSPEQMEQMTSFFSLLQSDFKNNVTTYADFMLFHAETKLEVKEQVKNNLSASNPTIGYNSLMNLMSYSQKEPKLLEELPYKLNLINSSGFPTNTTGLENHCKNGYNLKEIEGTGHYPMIEKSTEFNRLLEEILSEGV